MYTLACYLIIITSFYTCHKEAEIQRRYIIYSRSCSENKTKIQIRFSQSLLLEKPHALLLIQGLEVDLVDHSPSMPKALGSMSCTE